MSEGTKEQPWVLTTPSGQSEFEAWRDEAADPPALVVQVGKTQLRYDLRGIDDLHDMLRRHGDWVPLGSADEQKPAPEGSVEAWARAADNPLGAGTGCGRATGAGSPTTCPRCSSVSAWPRSSTTPAITGCGL